MHRLAVLVPMLIAGACSPAGEPLSPQFAGWWRPERAPHGCERTAMRFERDMVQVRRDGRTITAFDIIDTKLDGGEARLTLRVANEAAILAAIDQRRPAMATELPKRAIILSLRRSNERLLPGNPLIQEDGPRGLRAPNRGEANAIAQLFTMTPCAV